MGHSVFLQHRRSQIQHKMQDLKMKDHRNMTRRWSTSVISGQIITIEKCFSVQRLRLPRHKHVTDWERRVSGRSEHCQQLVVSCGHDLKRGVEVDFFGDLQNVKLPCRGEQQCCAIFPSIRNSTVKVVSVQLGCFVLSRQSQRELLEASVASAGGAYTWHFRRHERD